MESVSNSASCDTHHDPLCEKKFLTPIKQNDLPKNTQKDEFRKKQIIKKNFFSKHALYFLPKLKFWGQFLNFKNRLALMRKYK